MREPQDSMGHTTAIGDRMAWRGQIYTIKAFDKPVGRHVIRAIEFEELLHVRGEVPDEFSIDLVRSKR